MSRWLASDTGFPVSATSAARKSSKRFSMPSAILRSMSTRALQRHPAPGPFQRGFGRLHRFVHHGAVGLVHLGDHGAVDGIDLVNCFLLPTKRPLM